jgi:L-ribulose-5-phosphate 4-epimerase
MSDLYRRLKEEAWEANLEIPRQHLAIYTWGNSSAFDAQAAVFAIKPSGVSYDALKAEDMVVLDLEGRVVEGSLRPSSDTETHRVLYREFAAIGGITHTHSSYAVSWAQALLDIPVYGTTHADHCTEPIPCTAFMSKEAVEGHYELETGNLIVETFRQRKLSPAQVQMVLVAGHGPFTWGKDAAASVYNAAVLEEVAKMAHNTRLLADTGLPDYIIRKHWERKHGPKAYYGQN